MDNGEFSFLKVLGKALKVSWITLMIVSVAYSSLIDLSWMQAYRRIDWGLLGLQAISIPFIILFASLLYRLYPGVMGFGWWRIIKRLIGEKQQYHKDGTPKMEGGNINLIGTDIKYVGIIVCLLLMTALPRVAAMEEQWFRQGTINWWDAILRSLAFGFIHMAVGAPFFGALVLTGMGMFYSYLYFVGGVELSAQAHFQYNLILVSILLLLVTVRSLVPAEN